MTSNTCIGYTRGSYVYLYQDLAIQAVSMRTPGKKWDKSSISRLLYKEGWLAPEKSEVLADSPSEDSGRALVWIIKKAKLFSKEPEGNEPVGGDFFSEGQKAD